MGIIWPNIWSHSRATQVNSVAYKYVWESFVGALVRKKEGWFELRSSQHSDMWSVFMGSHSWHDNSYTLQSTVGHLGLLKQWQAKENMRKHTPDTHCMSTHFPFCLIGDFCNQWESWPNVSSIRNNFLSNYSAVQVSVSTGLSGWAGTGSLLYVYAKYLWAVVQYPQVGLLSIMTYFYPCVWNVFWGSVAMSFLYCAMYMKIFSACLFLHVWGTVCCCEWSYADCPFSHMPKTNSSHWKQ